VSVTREGSILRGPGIGDDCRGLAVVLAVAEALEHARVRTEGTIVFVGTVGEEGPGNLRGVRHLFEHELRDRVDAFVSVDGGGLGTTKDAVGSYRYRVTYRGPGGHSYGAFGMPNPIHALGRAIAAIADLDAPSSPRVTFNVGVIDGGTSVNSIAYEAGMEVDMRSVDPAALDRIDASFLAAVDGALRAERERWPESRTPLDVVVDRWGVRPAGSQPEDAPIVATAVAAARALGFETRLGAGSTDANIPINLGLPAITVGGGGGGGGSHSLQEWFDTADSQLGTRWVTLLTLALVGVADR
jgi:tripeptide aminopeptidase